MSEFGRLGANEIDRLLGEARQALAGLGEVRPGGKAETAPVTATAANELVRAEVASGGRLQKLTIDAKAMRLDSHTLAEELTKAVQKAQDEAIARQQVAAEGLPVVDPGQLGNRLDETQLHASRQLDVFGEALEGIVRRLEQRR
ncbi:YbaB/EbfC family nucleoid-associated protein [Fodinicola acaciae]|uniref:YbaB/EbfC family nucleoid-associated protein n=1 Tax=Fodinicola acaciae TaxID=2681555 RepID=UPI0013D80FED|nr:YbaB/EbfC family nucleoid-associated protein [Fodinicola acaciae]